MEDSTLETHISNLIKKVLSQEYNVKKADIGQESEVVPINHINKRFNTKFTKQDQVLKSEDKHALKNINTKFNTLSEEDLLIREKLKKTHKIKENDLEEIFPGRSQKTSEFDDIVEQPEQIEADMELNEENTALKIVNKVLKKTKNEKQDHTKRTLRKISKILNKTIDNTEALLKQKNYSQSDLKKNIQKIRQLTNKFQKINHIYVAEKWLTKYANFNANKLKLTKQVSKLKYEMQNIKFDNMHDIIDSHSEINQLQFKIRKFNTEVDNIKNQINKHDDEINRMGMKTLIRRVKKLEKETAASWKECYVESQKATADNQSTKWIDKKSFQIKNFIFHVVSKATTCIKEVTTLIFNKFIFEDEGQSSKETTPSDSMCQQCSQKAFSSTTKNLDDIKNTSTSKINNSDELPNMTETPKIVSELSGSTKELSNCEVTNKNCNEESPKILPSQVSKEKLNDIDDRKYECELIKQLGDTNMDNKSVDLEQVETKIKETHDVIETKTHDKVSEVDSIKHPIYSTLYSHVLKDYNIVTKDVASYKHMIYNPKMNCCINSELPEDKENFDINCKSIPKSSKFTVSTKSTKSFKSINNLPAKNVNAAQHRCIVDQNDTCNCNISKTIFTITEN
nr:PREDICTED: uncharacterized protein PFB0145c-like [Linepithema humile]